MDNRPIITTDCVSKEFITGADRVRALKDVTVDIFPGTLTVFKGRSGSGKTTLMNMLGALDMPTSGKVFFDGREITAMHEAQRDKLRLNEIGFVFQSVALISLMSAYENVEFALRLAGVDSKLWRPRVEECLGFIGLKNRMKHRPAELSGGEQQRVAIARAIAHHPKVIFADEPTAELDTHMGLQVMKLFRELVKKEGITIVMSTHDPNMMELADHVYSLDDGAVVDETFNTFPDEGMVGAQ